MSIRFVRSELPFTVSIQGATFKLQLPSAEKRFQLIEAAKAAGAPCTAYIHALLEESIIEWDGVFDVIAGKMILYDRAAVRDLPWPVIKYLISCLTDGEQEKPNLGNA